MNPAYILSTNYEKLYELISQGIEVVGFVTIQNPITKNPHPCKVSMSEGRWMIYSVDYQMSWDRTLEDLIVACTRLHLQYIVPNGGQVEELVKGLEESKKIIQLWHGMGSAPDDIALWEVYDKQSPEMKPINELIEKYK